MKNSAVTETTALKADVEQLKSDTQAIKNSAVSEITTLKNQAAASATNAANSATEAGKQATNAANSAKTAKTEADRSKTEADRSEAAANSTPDIQPLPDVWIPFNDSLDMITGFAPGYKKITVGDEEITLPSNKIVKFKRASTATYINKSGILTIAEVDEPRFERNGLLIEGQRTNYFLNSNSPALWNKTASIGVEESNDGRFNYGRVTVTNESPSAGGYQILSMVIGNAISGTTGDHITVSCRAKAGSNSRLRMRLAKVTDGVAIFHSDSVLNLDTGKVTSGPLYTSRSVKDGDWWYFETTFGFDTDLSVVCRFEILCPENESVIQTGASLNLATPQVEIGSCASSFIITEATPVTRASDMVTMPVKNNVSTLPWTCLVEVHRKWSIAPNAAPRIFDTAFHGSGKPFILAFSGNPDNINYKNVYVDIGDGAGRANRAIITPDYDFICGFRIKENFDVQATCQSLIGSAVKTNWRYIVESATLRIGGQTTTGERHLFGHVRNLRIWHKELTDKQMKEYI
ncbi:side tail fiber protein [Salmonella phage phA11]|uniref:Side tail fiber protein n=1 Tax=Salmonella phage phA11 TaxID=3038307 RepID=A0AAF0JYL8_9CAUD|nr:side tail fiber protein [Salmonella phage phA11]